MKSHRVRRRVWVALASGIVGVGTWLYWSRLGGTTELPQQGKSSPFVNLAGAGRGTGDQLLREKSELLDPTPLFFPTEHNFGSNPMRGDQARQPGQVFGRFEAKLPLSERGVPVYGQDAPDVPKKLSEVLGPGNETPFAGLGRKDAQTSLLPVRAGHIEIRRLSDGQLVVFQQLEGAVLTRGDARPTEFLAIVSAGGLVGEPFVLQGSDGEEVDAALRTFLVRSYRLGERLPPGRYRVTIGS